MSEDIKSAVWPSRLDFVAATEQPRNPLALITLTATLAVTTGQ